MDIERYLAAAAARLCASRFGAAHAAKRRAAWERRCTERAALLADGFQIVTSARRSRSPKVQQVICLRCYPCSLILSSLSPRLRSSAYAVNLPLRDSTTGLCSVSSALVRISHTIQRNGWVKAVMVTWRKNRSG